MPITGITGENLRVLRWIIDRCEHRVDAIETPIGLLPKTQNIDIVDLEIDEATLHALLSVNLEQWKAEMESVGEYLSSFGARLPVELQLEHDEVMQALREAAG